MADLDNLSTDEILEHCGRCLMYLFKREGLESHIKTRFLGDGKYYNMTFELDQKPKIEDHDNGQEEILPYT